MTKRRRYYVARTPGGDGWAIYDRMHQDEHGNHLTHCWVRSRKQGRWLLRRYNGLD